MLIGKQFVVSPLVDQYLNNRQNEILWRLLANPADNGHIYSHNLEQLSHDFPQCGLLRALYARSAGDENTAHAAVAFDTKALYVMIMAYENLAEVPEASIIQHLAIDKAYAANGNNEEAPVFNDFSHGELKDLLGFEPHTEIDETPQVIVASDEAEEVQAIEQQFETNDQAAELLEESPVAVFTEAIENAEPPAGDHRAEMGTQVFEEDVVETSLNEKPVAIEEQAELSTSAELPAEDERVVLHSLVYEEEPPQDAVMHTGQPDSDEQTPAEHSAIEPLIELKEAERPDDTPQNIIGLDAAGHQQDDEPEYAVIEQELDGLSPNTEGIDDDVYDEIVGIEHISFAGMEQPQIEPVEDLSNKIKAEPQQFNILHEEVLYEDEPTELIPESLAMSDYFVFERSETIEAPLEEQNSVEDSVPSAEVIAAPLLAEQETQYVSKYHDEQMPYTFLWWLDKTRKEHSGIYQPFKLDTTQAIKHTGDETLQQQYYENIFHVTTLSELDNGTTEPAVEFDEQRKEDRIIRKFIVEEPHISTPTGDKLDNENKARRSNEDQDELVTETLAKIYADQVLYHKAINTYKKLILKFPEKSRYFADQIEMLERKIN